MIDVENSTAPIRSPTQSELRELNAMPTPEGGRISVYGPVSELDGSENEIARPRTGAGGHGPVMGPMGTPARVLGAQDRPRSREEMGNYPHPATVLPGSGQEQGPGVFDPRIRQARIYRQAKEREDAEALRLSSEAMGRGQMPVSLIFELSSEPHQPCNFLDLY